MNFGAYMMQLLAGIFYGVASIAILLLALRTRQRWRSPGSDRAVGSPWTITRLIRPPCRKSFT